MVSSVENKLYKCILVLEIANASTYTSKRTTGDKCHMCVCFQYVKSQILILRKFTTFWFSIVDDILKLFSKAPCLDFW